MESRKNFMAKDKSKDKVEETKTQEAREPILKTFVVHTDNGLFSVKAVNLAEAVKKVENKTEEI